MKTLKQLQIVLLTLLGISLIVSVDLAHNFFNASFIELHDGILISGIFGRIFFGDDYEASPKDVDAVKNLVRRAGSKFKYHPELQQIIDEEADAYFSGQRSLSEVTELIQNRAGLYLQE